MCERETDRQRNREYECGTPSADSNRVVSNSCQNINFWRGRKQLRCAETNTDEARSERDRQTEKESMGVTHKVLTPTELYQIPART